MDAKKIAKNTGKGAGIVAMAFLAGAAAYGQAQADAERARNPRVFRPRYSDEHDMKMLVLDNGDQTMVLLPKDDGSFVVLESTVKGVKPERVVEIKNDRLVRDFVNWTKRSVYLSESTAQRQMVCWGTREPLLFTREDKHGEMVPSFIEGGWSAYVQVEAV